MLKSLNLHNITSISIDEVNEISDNEGADFHYRVITFVNEDDEDFSITLYSHDFDKLQIKY